MRFRLSLFVFLVPAIAAADGLTDLRATLSRLHERMLAGLTSDRASTRRLCRLCDVDACGHHRGTCPVTNARAAASPAA